MKRKVIKQANQAYTITLPIDWVRKNNINEKSELEISKEGRSLILLNQGAVEHKIAEIDVSNETERNISRIINAFYARGIDEIKIISNKDVSSEIIRGLRNNIGFALVSQKDNLFIIKDIGGNSNSDLDEIFKRVFQMILSFYESAINDVFGDEKETMESLIARDIEINKFCLFLERAINKMSYSDPIVGRAIFTYAFEIEKIGDEIQRLWRTNIKYKVKKNDRVRKLVDKSFNGLGKAFEFYYQFNSKKAEEIMDLRNDVRENSLKISEDKFTNRFIRHAVKIIEEATDLNQLTLMIKLI